MKIKRKFKVTNKINPGEVPAPNLIQQNFIAAEPNKRWVTNLSYERLPYLTAVIHLFFIFLEAL
jgi:hypothetical protein